MTLHLISVLVIRSNLKHRAQSSELRAKSTVLRGYRVHAFTEASAGNARHCSKGELFASI